MVALTAAHTHPMLRAVRRPTVDAPPKTDGDDASLVERALRGDVVATDALFRRHAGALLGLVTRLVGRRQDAEDIAQEALAVALEELPTLRERGAFGPWLRTIAARQAHRYFRRRKLLRVFGLDRGADDATLAAQAAPDATPEQRAALAALDGVLAALPAEHRVAWCLRYVEGERLDAVAAACGCSLATAKRRIAAAHAKVTERVSLGGEEP